MKNKKEKKENVKKINKVFIFILRIIFITLLLFSLYNIIYWIIDNKNNTNQIEKIKNYAVIDNIENMEINFDSLEKENSDIVAWIKVEGTEVNYPVVQTSDNNYYLTHSFDKSLNKAGWIFADCSNKFDGSDKNIVLYGHNRRDGSMFSSLRNILKADWYNNKTNRNVTLITKDEKLKYEVFSVYQVENEEYYLTTNFTKQSFKEYLQLVKNRSIIDFEVSLNENDELLTLSTCANDNNYRVVLHAKKIQENNSDEEVLNEQ